MPGGSSSRFWLREGWKVKHERQMVKWRDMKRRCIDRLIKKEEIDVSNGRTGRSLK